jgi:hypothetical protein
MRDYPLLPNMDWVMEGRYVFSFTEFMFLPLLIGGALLCFCFPFPKSIFLMLDFSPCIYYDKQRHFSMLSLFCCMLASQMVLFLNLALVAIKSLNVGALKWCVIFFSTKHVPHV